jgi:phosphoribosylaminoimidazole carboxylase
VATWREVASPASVLEAAAELGYPVRVKAVRGGYDGRSQVRLADIEGIEAIDGRIGWPALLERELDFVAELSVVIARNVDGISRAFPLARNRHDRGILVESVVPAGVPDTVEKAAKTLAENLATSMGLVGTLTVELFLMRDGSLVVNELAPRVHNSGHWSIEGVTSQFEQHLRAICGCPWVRRDARTGGRHGQPARRGRAPPGAPDGSYGARHPRRAPAPVRQGTVFERRKMGHVTPRAKARKRSPGREAAAHIGWAPEPERRGRPAATPVVGGSAAAARISRCSSRRRCPAARGPVRAPRRLHRSPDLLYEYAESAADRGIRVIIAGAGGAAHLPGMLAAKTRLPVIGVPMPTKALDGIDSLLSIVQMPRGIPVATVAIGDAENEALLAVEILALSDAALAARLDAYRADLTRMVLDDPSNATG